MDANQVGFIRQIGNDCIKLECYVADRYNVSLLAGMGNRVCHDESPILKGLFRTINHYGSRYYAMLTGPG